MHLSSRGRESVCAPTLATQSEFALYRSAQLPLERVRQAPTSWYLQLTDRRGWRLRRSEGGFWTPPWVGPPLAGPGACCLAGQPVMGQVHIHINKVLELISHCTTLTNLTYYCPQTLVFLICRWVMSYDVTQLLKQFKWSFKTREKHFFLMKWVIGDFDLSLLDYTWCISHLYDLCSDSGYSCMP